MVQMATEDKPKSEGMANGKYDPTTMDKYITATARMDHRVRFLPFL